MSIIDDFKAYTDKFGLVTPKNPPETSGNGLRYTAEYVVALCHNTKDLSDEEYIPERDRIVRDVLKCQVHTGLYKRHPEDGRLEAPDDYVGLGTISEYLDFNIAKEILEYGRNNKCFGIIPYVYNNCEPGKWNIGAWLGRQQQVICHLQFAAREKPPLWRKLWWCIALLISTKLKRGEQDNYVLSWHLVKVAEHRSWLCDLAIKYWRTQVKKIYPGGISEVLGEYFNNNDHPSVNWLKNID